MPEGLQLTWVDGVGFMAGGIMLWGMFKRTMIPVRLALVCGNIGFLMFGIFAPSYPTLITHLCLLPLNTLRLYQVWALVRDIRDAEQSDLSLDMLLPYMKASDVKAGTVLFRKDDAADRMIIIKEGTVLLEELGSTCGPGSVLGEVAAFTPDGLRTATAVAQTDCHIFSLDNELLIQIYYQNPAFGLYLIRTIVHRLLENWQAAEDRARLT
jgi:hypothetical protein